MIGLLLFQLNILMKHLIRLKINFLDPHLKTLKQPPFKGAEATCVEVASEMKKCFRPKDMPNFNVF